MSEPTMKLGPYFTYRCAVCGAEVSKRGFMR